MAKQEHVKILKQGVKKWNEWREANRQIRADLSGADLSGADLSGADLIWADLSRASLRETDLQGARLSWANLSEANLRIASLRETDLYDANLSGANLNGTDLSGACLRFANLTLAHLDRTNLSGVDLSETIIGRTSFIDVDLSPVMGWESLHHEGPSSIGIDTIYLSKGKIPAEFLRGVGVPENFIEYMGSLVGTAFDFYSCFISYSGKDQEFAKRIFVDLQQEGVRCWFAPHHAQAGKKLHEQIDVAIRLHEKLLLILSPDSINSEWVKTEIAKARKRESQEKKRVLFPVRLNISYEQLQK
jgi:uncharacterized protein YjbI with pentapeptide repeats